MSGKTKYTPPIEIEAVGPIRGRLHLTARYVSSRSESVIYTTKGKDDGTPESCDCPAGKHRGACRHLDNLALDYFRWKWHGAPLDRLVECDRNLRHWLSLGPDAADEAAARIELTVIGDYIGERTADQAAA